MSWVGGLGWRLEVGEGRDLATINSVKILVDWNFLEALHFIINDQRRSLLLFGRILTSLAHNPECNQSVIISQQWPRYGMTTAMWNNDGAYRLASCRLQRLHREFFPGPRK